VFAIEDFASSCFDILNDDFSSSYFVIPSEESRDLLFAVLFW